MGLCFSLLQPFSILSKYRNYQSMKTYTDRRNEEFVYLDKDFSDLMVVPSSLFADVNSSSLVTEGLLVFQDKASICASHYLKTLKSTGMQIIDTRAGCGMVISRKKNNTLGTKTVELAALAGQKGKVLAFENRPGRLESLKHHLSQHQCKSKSQAFDPRLNFKMLKYWKTAF